MAQAADTKKLTPKQRISRHYYAVMPNKKHHRVLVWVVFLLIVGTIAAQMLYPLNRAVPFASLAGRPVGFTPELQLAEQIAGAFPDAKIRLQAGTKTTEEIALVKAGAEQNADAMVRMLTDYPFWQRFVPGSILWQRPNVADWKLDYATVQLSKFAQQQAAILTHDPINAGVAIKDGVLMATADQPGIKVVAEDISKAIINAAPKYGVTTTIAVAAQSIVAAKTAEDLSSVKSQAQAALNIPVQIQANGLTFTPDNTEKAGWLRLSEDQAGKTTLSVDTDKLNSYIDNVVAKQAGKPAGQTNIVLQNGREVGRQTGELGLRVNNPPLAELITNYLLKKQGRPPFIAEMVTVQPSIIYNSSYTATQEGLQAYISEKAKHGAWISIRQLDGQQWAAGSDDHDSVVSGSTYKLYVALYLFKEMDAGTINWGTPILDTNTDTCFNRMTIASTNPCAEEWLRQFGRTNVNDYLYGQGFSTATTFTHPEAAHTSAADLTKYMIGLEQGTLISGAHRDRLLYSLSHHPYRYGIPTGSAGQVWDKVGFVFDYVNDTAIVHHPKGTYVMTIMTQGQSYGAIAAMTREIEKIMYP